MPAYKDTERQTPEELAEFILKDRICDNCKFYSPKLFDSVKGSECENKFLYG